MTKIICIFLLFTAVAFADVPASDGFMVFIHNGDGTSNFIRDTITMFDFSNTLLYLQLNGVPCDSIFNFKWEIYWEGDSTDFLSMGDTLFVDDPYNTFTYWPPNTVGDCDSIVVIGDTPARMSFSDSDSNFTFTKIFYAHDDSLRSFFRTTTTNEQLTQAILELRLLGVSCSSMIFWGYTVDLDAGFLEDAAPPYPLVDEDCYGKTIILMDDCELIVPQDPF